MEDPHPDLVEENRLLERAIRHKWNKFTWSGLLITIVGILIICGGLSLDTSLYSPAGLVVALGFIVVLIGIIRILIGIINPLSPKDLHSIHSPGGKSS